MPHTFVTRICVAALAGFGRRGPRVRIHLDSCSPQVEISSLVGAVAMRRGRWYVRTFAGRRRRYEVQFESRLVLSALLSLSRASRLLSFLLRSLLSPILSVSILSCGLVLPSFFPSPVSPCRGSSPEIPRSDPVSGDKSKSSGE
jgi:hypothetical protein